MLHSDYNSIFFIEQWSNEWVVLSKIPENRTDGFSINQNLKIDLEIYRDVVKKYGGTISPGIFKLTIFQDSIKAGKFIEDYLEPQYIGKKLGGEL